jgi:hypothetical protein
MIFKYKTLTDFYEELTIMKRYGHYTIDELENLMPYELEVHSALTLKLMKQEQEQQNASTNR